MRSPISMSASGVAQMIGAANPAGPTEFGVVESRVADSELARCGIANVIASEVHQLITVARTHLVVLVDCAVTVIVDAAESGTVVRAGIAIDQAARRGHEVTSAAGKGDVVIGPPEPEQQDDVVAVFDLAGDLLEGRGRDLLDGKERTLAVQR